MSRNREEYRFKNVFISLYTHQIDLKKKTKPESTGDNVEKLESFCIIGGNVKWYSHYGKPCFLKKLPSICLLGKRIESKVSNRCLYMTYAHNNIIHSSQKVEAT